MNVSDVMTRLVKTVSPELTLAELDRLFLAERVSSFAVLNAGRLAGIVSRSDVVRGLAIEQSVGEQLSDAYRDEGSGDDPGPSLAQIGEFVGQRIQEMTVADVMVHDVVTIAPDASLAEAAELLVKRRIHRLPVVEGEALVGLISATDFVRLTAEGALRPK